MKELLALKKTMKAKRPNFLRTDAGHVKKLKDKYRRPRGLHNKLRLHRASHGYIPSPGYRVPRAVRNYTREGFKKKLIHSIKDLDHLKKDEIAFLASSLGIRARVQILEKALQKKIIFGNIKDVSAFLTTTKEEMQKRKQDVKKKEEKKKKGQEEALKKAEEKKQEKTPEEKKEQEEADKKKILQQERVKAKVEEKPKLPQEIHTRMIPGDKK